MTGSTPAAEEGMITDINVTPLVDVSLVLVIIFMVVAPFLTYILKPLELPRAERSALNERDAIRISVFPDRTVALGGALVDEQRLGERIRLELAGGRPSWVLIRADARVPHGRVMRIVRIAKEAGTRRIAFAAQSAK